MISVGLVKLQSVKCGRLLYACNMLYIYLVYTNSQLLFPPKSLSSVRLAEKWSGENLINQTGGAIAVVHHLRLMLCQLLSSLHLSL
jgi:hypothetical protein